MALGAHWLHVKLVFAVVSERMVIFMPSASGTVNGAAVRTRQVVWVRHAALLYKVIHAPPRLLLIAITRRLKPTVPMPDLSRLAHFYAA
jgi:hypothetical protein